MTRRDPARCADAVLVRRIRRGDAVAFGALWTRHEGAARRALAAIGADPGVHLPLIRVATSAALRGPTHRADPVRRHILRIVGRWGGPGSSPTASVAASIDRDSPILRAYTGLGRRARTLLWYSTVEDLGPAESAALLGGGTRRIARRTDAARRRLLRRWLVGAHARGLDEACYRVRRHELIGGARELDRALREHAGHCPPCVIAAGSSQTLLDHLGALLISAELGPDAGGRYRGTDRAAHTTGPEAAASGTPFDDVRFSGLAAHELPTAGLTRSAMTVLDSDGFEYSLGPVLVPEDRMRALLEDLAEAAEQV